MNKILDAIINNSKVSIAILLTITLILAFGLTKLEMGNNQDSELPEDDKIVQTKKNIEEIFGRKDVILLGIETENIFNPSTLNKIRDIEDEIKKIKGVIPEEVTSILSINNVKGSEEGLDVGMHIQNIPTNSSELKKIKDEAIDNELMSGRLISKDGRFSAIMATVEEGYSEEYIFEEIEKIVDKYKGPEKIYATGDPIQQKEIDLGIKGDMSYLLPIAFLLLLVTYFFAFRSFVGMMIPFLVVIISIVWTMGFMGLIGYKVTVVSSVIPILMLVISGSYGIHFMQKFFEEYDGNNFIEARKKAIKLTFSPILLTGITSSIGTFTLIVFKVTSIKEFGLVASVGIIFTVIISLLFISSVLWLVRNKKISAKAQSQNAFLNRALYKVGLISVRKTKTILFISTCVLLLSIWGTSFIKVGNDFIEYFPKEHRLRQTYNIFNEKLGGARYIDLMFENIKENDVQNPEFLKKVDEYIKHSHTSNYVGNTFSIIDIIKRMNKEFHNGDPQYYSIPDNQEEIAQYLLLYSMSGNPSEYGSLVDYENKRMRVRMMLTSSDQEDHMILYDNLQRYAQENLSNSVKVEYGGEVMFWLAQVDYIVKGKIENIMCAIFIVLIICSLLFRSIKLGLVSIIPLSIASLLTFGLMGFLSLRLETATAIITSVGIGIGVDFALHYLISLRRQLSNEKVDLERAVTNVTTTTGKAIVFDIISNILGFVIFLLSGFTPLQDFGWLISLTMLGCGLGSLFLFPALIKTLNIKLVK